MKQLMFTAASILCLLIAPALCWLPSMKMKKSSFRMMIQNDAESTNKPLLPTISESRSMLKNGAASAMISLILTGLVGGDACSAASPSLASLETAISSLESAKTRADTIQGLADVFEAAGTKTLLVRTKYKTRIITAVNDKHASLNNEWDSILSYESGELKRRVDPFRTVDLKGYFQIAPVVGGVCYLGALFIQQAIPELFVFAYPLAVVVFSAPIIFTVLTT